MALTAPCANRPTCPTCPTSPTFFALSIGSAQCAPPANRTRSHVHLIFQGAWLTESQSPTPYSSVPVRTRLRYATPWQAGTATAWRCRNIAAARCRPTPCALRNALRQPVEMCYVLWRTHCTWSTGGNLTFPPVYPLFARVL